jgi:hypothetical protein
VLLVATAGPKVEDFPMSVPCRHTLHRATSLRPRMNKSNSPTCATARALATAKPTRGGVTNCFSPRPSIRERLPKMVSRENSPEKKTGT